MTAGAEKFSENKTLAYVAPFLAYMLLLPVTDFVRIDNDDLPWWRFAPEHWLFPLQTIISLGLIAFFWKQYTFAPIKGLGFGAVIGVVGIMVWILPAFLYDQWNVAGWAQPAWAEKLPLVSEDRPLWAFLGLSARADGFNPTIFSDHAIAYWSAVLMRFIRMTIAVAFFEEIFWRGFLWRYLSNRDKPFWKIPFGIKNWKAIGITIGLFVLVHAPEDYLGAIIYGTLISWVALRTKSLAACVVCHGVSNLMLGLYIMNTHKWGLW
jgi:membrane protease YdiL (CAAX protease family)